MEGPSLPLSGFTVEGWNQLSPDERIAQCQHMAATARELAQQTSGDMKAAYLEIARGWDRLAQEMRRAPLGVTAVCL